jgi:CheY-like chemotaxis protein
MRKSSSRGEDGLRGLRVLVVEDEYFLVDEIVSRLQACGATVIGPAGNLEDGMELLADGALIDAAVLDVNLQGQMAFPIASQLRRRGIPFVFATGYDCRVIPSEYRNVPCWEKPLDALSMARSLRELVANRMAMAELQE